MSRSYAISLAAFFILSIILAAIWGVGVHALTSPGSEIVSLELWPHVPSPFGVPVWR
jgi:hypothetical protein